MINLIIFACVCLTAALFLIGFMCYHIVKMSQSLNKLNLKYIQNDMMMQLVGQQFKGLETKFEEQLETLKAIPKAPPPSAGFMPKEVIEQNYERAKNLLKRGMPLDRELMSSCQMTEEEFELLAETLTE
jgi:hypothetical protein